MVASHQSNGHDPLTEGQRGMEGNGGNAEDSPQSNLVVERPPRLTPILALSEPTGSTDSVQRGAGDGNCRR